MGDVPPDVNLDPGSLEFIGHRFERFAELRATCPVAYDGAHGGFWLVTDYESVVAVENDNETFAHRYEVDAPDGITYDGICGIPRVPGNPRLGVAEIDGPDHHDLRRALNPVFTPPAVERLRPTMERITAWFLDQHIERGSLDLVLDFTSPVPAVLTLQMMGLPCERWEQLRGVLPRELSPPERLAGVHRGDRTRARDGGRALRVRDGVVTTPATFTPGPRSGPVQRPF